MDPIKFDSIIKNYKYRFFWVHNERQKIKNSFSIAFKATISIQIAVFLHLIQPIRCKKRLKKIITAMQRKQYSRYQYIRLT